MIAYEFYIRNVAGKMHLIGILPERRKIPERITDESIVNWVRNVVGKSASLRNVFFTKVTLE